MAYVLRDLSDILSPVDRGTYPTVEDAVRAIGQAIVEMSEDATYPDHWDVFTTRCAIFTIEPERGA